MSAHILTLDAGTTGLKCSVFSSDGALVASSVAPYGVDYSREGWAEQPVDTILEAAVKAVCLTLDGVSPRAVEAIGLSGTSNGCIATDASGRALYPNIIHLDIRAVRELDAIRSAVTDREYYERTGNRLDVHYTLPKLLWLRGNLPEVYERARWFVNTKDAIYSFLTGRIGYTDYSDASLTGALYMREKRWDSELLKSLGLDAGRMPEIRISGDVEGRLSRHAAGLLGLREGIPVAAGASDGACATHGAGVFTAGQAYCNIGSSAWLAMLTEQQVIDPGMRVFNFIDMDGVSNTVCGTVQSAASAFDWAAQQMLYGRPALSGEEYRALEAAALESPVGANGLFFLPTFMGERTPWWDPDARGALIGITQRHTRADIVRSIYEGVMQALHLCMDVFEKNGLSFGSLSMIGGSVQSAVWPRMFADAFHVAAQVHAHPREATSLGAAIAAGVGAGIFPNYAEAAKLIRHAKRCEPDPDRHRQYAKHFEVYRSLYANLSNAYHMISKYQNS